MSEEIMEMECEELKCSVCIEYYSDTQLPRSLACGHSVCSSCLDMVILNCKRCPECRTNFPEGSTSEVSINYPLLRLCRVLALEKSDLKLLPEPKLPLSYTSRDTEQDAGNCPAHGCPLFFMCIRCGVWVCRDCVVVDHPDPPRGRCFILSVKEAIHKIKKSHIATLDLYRSESMSTSFKLERVLRSMSKVLKRSSSSHTDDVQRVEFEKHREAVTPLLASLEHLVKSLVEAKTKMSNVVSPKELQMSMDESTACQTACEELVENEKNVFLGMIRDVFLCGKKELGELLADGQKPVFVVTDIDGKDSWAPVLIKDDGLHLYSLREGIPPEGGHYLPFDYVRDQVPKESPMVFLEVARNGETVGHVYIRMFGDTPRGQQMTYLCSGEKGPSYRTTCFHETGQENGAQFVRGGDYEKNDGRGGQAVVDDLNTGHYTDRVRAGFIAGWPLFQKWRLATFSIYLDDAPTLFDYACYGKVEKGLDVVKEAANTSPITAASVADCGLIIPIS